MTRLAAALALRLYGAALVVLPRAVRGRFAADMRATIRARVEDAAADGVPAVAAFLARELLDLAIAAVGVRLGSDPSLTPL